MIENTESSLKQHNQIPQHLSAFLEAKHNVWLQSSTETGHLSLFNRKGVFIDLEAMAVDRKHLLDLIGKDRLRALLFRIGMEQGRRDAARHFLLMNNETSLAINAYTVFGQLKGLYEGRLLDSVIDLEKKDVRREVALYRNYEALAHCMFEEKSETCVCWSTAGYLSGHLGELTGRRILTQEIECIAQGAECCRFISKLDFQWGDEIEWARNALISKSIASEMSDIEAKAQKAIEKAEQAESAFLILRRRYTSPVELSDLVCNDDSMQNAVRKAMRIAHSHLPVLLTGPQGSGKETLARCIHMESQRGNKPFMVFDCQYVQGKNAAKELFGYESGAFPGALREYDGLLKRADGGVIYLENIDNLSKELQGMFIRLLKDNVFYPLGSTEGQSVDVRIMASLRYDAEKAVMRHDLSDDLRNAFSIATIEIPPLCRRRKDIPDLFERFTMELRERYNRPDIVFCEEVKHVLIEYCWPGNVTQFKAALEHAILFAQEDKIHLNDLPDEVLSVPASGSTGKLPPETIKAALRKVGGRKGEAAEQLGVSRTTLWRLMRELGID